MHLDPLFSLSPRLRLNAGGSGITRGYLQTTDCSCLHNASGLGTHIGHHRLLAVRTARLTAVVGRAVCVVARDRAVDADAGGVGTVV